MTTPAIHQLLDLIPTANATETATKAVAGFASVRCQLCHDHIVLWLPEDTAPCWRCGACAGTPAAVPGFDLLAYLQGQPYPVSTETAAHASVGRTPTPNETAAVRNRLRRLHQKGKVTRTEVPTLGGGKPTALWSVPESAG